MLVFGYSQQIKFRLLYLNKAGNKILNATITYELVDSDGTIVTSGTLSETSGEYFFSYTHAYTTTTNLDLRLKQGSKYIGGENILIFENSDANTQTILEAVDVADRYNNGEAI